MQNFRNGVWLALVLDFYCYSCLLLLANGHPFTIAALWLSASYLLFLLSFFRYIFLNIYISASKGLFHLYLQACKKKGVPSAVGFPHCAGSGEGLSLSPKPNPHKCAEAGARTRDLPVTDGRLYRCTRPALPCRHCCAKRK